MSVTTVCKLALLGQCTLTASWHPNFPGSSHRCHGSYRKSLGHLLYCPPPPSCLISFHRLSSNYGVVHFILSADGEGVCEFRGWRVLCYTGHTAYCRNVRWMEKYQIGWLVTYLCISDFERLYTSSLTCLFIYPSIICADSLVWLKGMKPGPD